MRRRSGIREFKDLEASSRGLFISISIIQEIPRETERNSERTQD
jgi:hypothetical protein